ncbi:hypothetical protein D5S17_27795 [Pseudonocardiaceae bacterium YIM PH 21723]|nr:hypothetical protein D5S17_27795 [Pseudonocardiaceae bacterium YIM PH 21723]
MLLSAGPSATIANAAPASIQEACGFNAHGIGDHATYMHCNQNTNVWVKIVRTFDDVTLCVAPGLTDLDNWDTTAQWITNAYSNGTTCASTQVGHTMDH